MPTYVYECQRCGARFELLQGINDPPRQRCPECRGKVKRLLMPGGGFIFKGSGFYITDYKHKEDKSRATKEKAETSGAAGSGDSSGSKDGASGDKAAGGTGSKGPDQAKRPKP